MADELRPCPFCGAEVYRSDGDCAGDANYIVHVPKVGGNDCGATRFSDFNSQRDLVELWNTRMTPTPVIGEQS